jgi:hypothetical protein
VCLRHPLLAYALRCCPLSSCRKASGSLKILHEAYAKNADARQRLTDSLASAIAANEAIAQCMSR